ncbi:MAG TPA: C-type lectin domain-containing protein [Polyangiaceae bacterium]
MITLRMPVLSRARRNGGTKFFWLGVLFAVVACSGSDKIDFFEPSTGGSAGTGAATGGSSGTSAGTDSGGSSGGGTTSTGGASGDASGGTAGTNGGTAGETGGTAGDTGGSAMQGGTDPGAGMGGMPTGGTGGKGGTGGMPMAGDGGTAGSGMGGSSGNAMGGAGANGAGMGGAGMAGSAPGGAGMSGAGTGGGGAGGSAGCVPTNPSTERCDGVDNNCTGGIDEGNACPDHCTGATRAGHTYMFCSFENVTTGTRLRTWMQAQDFCASPMRNLNLVFIESAEEDAFILEWITRLGLQDQVWMGANDRDPTVGLSNEGDWVWGTANNAVQFWNGAENGSPVMNRYNDWAGGEPNNMGNEDCGVFSADHDFHWDDRMCNNMYPNFVCESGVAITPN